MSLDDNRTLSVTLLICCLFAVAGRVDAQRDVRPLGEIKSGSEAIEMAWQYMGQPRQALAAAATGISCIPDTIRNDNLAFLRTYLEGRLVYRVEFSPGSLDSFRSAVAGEGKMWTDNDRSLTLVIDQETGALIRARSLKGSLDSARFYPVTAESSERQLKQGFEKYIEFPKEPPRSNLADVLRASPINPFEAVEFEVYFLLRSPCNPVQPKLVWVIYLNGIVPIPFHGPGKDQIPVYQLNHRRVIVDDASGRLAEMDTHPQPPLTPEDRARLSPPDSLLHPRRK